MFGVAFIHTVQLDFITSLPLYSMAVRSHCDAVVTLCFPALRSFVSLCAAPGRV